MKSKEKILATAFDLFIEKGFGGVSMALIVKESGISNGAVYHHFKSKKDLIDKLFYDYIDEIIQYMDDNIDKNLGIRGQFFLIWKLDIEFALQDIRRNRFCDMYSNSEYAPAIWMDHALEGFDIFRELYDRALAEDVITQIDRRYFMSHFKHSLSGVVDYLSMCPENNTEEFVKQSFKMFWRSIANI